MSALDTGSLPLPFAHSLAPLSSCYPYVSLHTHISVYMYLHDKIRVELRVFSFQFSVFNAESNIRMLIIYNAKVFAA